MKTLTRVKGAPGNMGNTRDSKEQEQKLYLTSVSNNKNISEKTLFTDNEHWDENIYKCVDGE